MVEDPEVETAKIDEGDVGGDSGDVSGRSNAGRRGNASKCNRNFMRRFMKSRRLHVVVVILVILDSICVSVELIVDLIVTVYNQHKQHHDAAAAASYSAAVAASRPNQTSNPVVNRAATVVPSPLPLSPLPQPTYLPSDEYLWSFISDMNFSSMAILISIETFFKYFGLIILSLFVIEIICKIIFIPRELARSKWGIFDAIVVFTSFILDVILLKDKKILHTVSGLITLFR